MQEDKNAVFQMRFPQKLWYLLNLRPDAILWGGTGRTILLNYQILQNYLMSDHSVFKTTNISSFVRQLNLYGFRKVTSHLQDPLCNSSNPYMHEYVHDYFQFGRPELLNKITRKALTIKRNFKLKSTYNNVNEMLSLTPLQKARHAFRTALKNAARDLFMQDSSNPFDSTQFECDDSQDDLYEDEETFEFDWSMNSGDTPPEPAAVDQDDNNNEKNNKPTETSTLRNMISFGETNQDSLSSGPNQDSLMSFTDETSQQSADTFQTIFLSMPNLDTEPSDRSGVELLAEFDINHDIDAGITRKIGDEHRSLNCVLPSISHDQNDDVSISENSMNMGHYSGDWDQMFNDMINRCPNQESGSELKELYSQISKTIDLLNS